MAFPRQAPDTEWGTLLGAFERALQLERAVNDQLLVLHWEAQEKNDPHVSTAAPSQPEPQATTGGLSDSRCPILSSDVAERQRFKKSQFPLRFHCRQSHRTKEMKNNIADFLTHTLYH